MTSQVTRPAPASVASTAQSRTQFGGESPQRHVRWPGAGISAGGDDYVTKPFSLEEVLARLRGLLRRAGLRLAASTSTALSVGDLTMDEDAHEVHRSGDLVELSATEFELLRFLMRNPRRVVSKTQILDRVWNYDFGGDARVLETYISYLRKKLDAHGPSLIHTVRGVGYALRLPRA